MKKILLSTFVLALACGLQAQPLQNGYRWDRFFFTGSMAIGKNSASTVNPASYAPDCALLEVGKDSTSKGVLLTRVVHLSDIAAPKPGLLAYVYDSSAYCFYNGTAWQKFGTGSQGGGGGGSADMSAVAAAIRDSLYRYYDTATVNQMFADQSNDFNAALDGVIAYGDEHWGGGIGRDTTTTWDTTLKRNNTAHYDLNIAGHKRIYLYDNDLAGYISIGYHPTEVFPGSGDMGIYNWATELVVGNKQNAGHETIIKDDTLKVNVAVMKTAAGGEVQIRIPSNFSGKATLNIPVDLNANDTIATRAFGRSLLGSGGGGGASTDDLDSVLARGNQTGRTAVFMDPADTSRVLSFSPLGIDYYRLGKYTFSIGSLGFASGAFRIVNPAYSSKSVSSPSASLWFTGTDFPNDTLPNKSGTLALRSDVDSMLQGAGTVTNVRLTMPSAFSVTGSPITTMGTLSVTANGSSAQYITGAGALATFAHTHAISEIVGLPDTLLNMWSAIASASGGSSVWSTDANGAFYSGNIGVGKGSNASYRLDLKTSGNDLALRVNSDGAPYPTGGVFTSGRTALFVSNGTLSGLTFLNYNKSAGATIGIDFGTDTAGNGNVVADAGFKFHTDYRGLEFTSVNTTGSNPAIKFTTLSRAIDFYGGYLDKHLLYIDAVNGRVGIKTNTPSEALDIVGAGKVGDGGYTGVTDGATTPVPNGSGGTFIYSSGHFYGWTGTAWKQLDN